jgi:hypothetical protein
VTSRLTTGRLDYQYRSLSLIETPKPLLRNFVPNSFDTVDREERNQGGAIKDRLKGNGIHHGDRCDEVQLFGGTSIVLVGCLLISDVPQQNLTL